MTVKNYVLDINKTSLQHPSIVLRQDDYNIYTVNISVTDNGTPVDLGSYTLNFLGITPAGAKIIDSKNFITTAGDLKSGKFSYRFPKEAAGSKGVYDVAYFRLSTTSGATSTIDLNLRVLGGIDLTADEVKDYITVDDTLRNTLVSEVFKRVDAKVDKHLATVKKGDKGDKGDPGKDAEIPVIGVRNLLTGTSNELKTVTRSGWGKSPTNLTSGTYGAGRYYASAYVENTTPVGVSLFVSVYLGGKFSHNLSTKAMPAGQSGIVSFTFDILEGHTIDSAFVGFVSSQTESYTYKYKEMIVTRTTTDWSPAPEDIQSDINKRAIDTSVVHNTGDETVAGNKTFTGTIYANNRIQGSLATRIANFTDLATVAADMYSYQGVWWFGSGTLLNSPISSYVLVEVFHGSIKTNGYIRVTSAISGDSYYANVNRGLSTWNKYAKDATVVHNTGDETVAGNKTYVGDNTYMGTNTFMDGLSLNGKNKVNDIKDTDWLDIPLAEGRTGTAKYKVSLGKVFVHLDGVKGITASGNNAKGQIGTLPVNPSPYYSRYTVQSGSKVMGLTIAANGTIYIANSMGNPITEDDPFFFDTVLM